MAQDNDDNTGWWDTATSYLNPKNWGVKRIDADNFSKAYEQAKKDGQKEFIYNNKRYTTDYNGSVKEEMAQYGTEAQKQTIVKNNEEPINIYIYHFGASNYMGVTSHAAMEYKGETIDFSSSGFSSSLSCKDSDVYCYQLFPSEIGLKPEDITKAIEKKKKAIKGKDYDFFSNNCCDQVIDVLRDAGANKPAPEGSFLADIRNEGTIIAIPQKFEKLCQKYGHQTQAKYTNHIIKRNEIANDARALRDYINILKDRKGFIKNLTPPKEFKAGNSSLTSFVKNTHKKINDSIDYSIRVKRSTLSDKQIAEEIQKLLIKYKNSNTLSSMTVPLFQMTKLPDETKKLLRETGVEDTILNSRYAKTNPLRYKDILQPGKTITNDIYLQTAQSTPPQHQGSERS